MERTKVTFNNERLKTSIEIMRALAHPLRLKILEFIDSKGATNVNKIYRQMHLEQSITSQHLRIMRLAGIVEARREGKLIFYSINYPAVIQAEQAIENFKKAEKSKV